LMVCSVALSVNGCRVGAAVDPHGSCCTCNTLWCALSPQHGPCVLARHASAITCDLALSRGAPGV
jgi:hypothetical protein